jgi:hypothetical protein
MVAAVVAPAEAPTEQLQWRQWRAPPTTRIPRRALNPATAAETDPHERARNPMNPLPSYAFIVTITLCIAVVPALAAISYVAARQRGSPRRSALGVSLGVGALLATWLAAAVATGGADVFLGRPEVIAGVLLIPIFAGVLLTRISVVRDALAAPRVLALLTLANVWRVLGIVFITLYLQHLLPAQFALPAGIVDVIIGLAAPVVAYAMWKHPARRRLPITFHALGLLDLAMAVTLGVTSAPGALQLFTGEPRLFAVSSGLLRVRACRRGWGW